MNNSAHKDVTTQEVQMLLVEGAKYSASGDPEKAAKCYARILDLESQNAEIYFLLARCLYGLGLKRNDVFGGGNEDEDEDVDVDEEDEEDNEDDDAEKKQKANSRLYQFDNEEEDVNESTLQNFEDVTNASAYVDARGESILQAGQDESKQQQDDDNDDNDDDDDESEANMSIGETFEDFLQGNLFENALELLYRARIMYMEPQGGNKKDSEELSKDTQLKLGQLYDLLGDIDQELEDFTQAVRDYEESLKFFDKSLAPEERDVLVQVYLKLTDTLRWSDLDDKDSLSKEQRQGHLQELVKLISSRIDDGTSKDVEADKNHLERLKEDQESLKLDKPKTGKSVVPELMAQAILRQALGGSQGKVNDLSKAVKKKKTMKSNKNKGSKRK